MPKSILLLGPRQVGKSTLIDSLKPDLTIDLANELEFLTHSSNPGELSKIVDRAEPKSVFIDEVQRLPKILNTAQSIIDHKKIKFYLTGSSGRKLKRDQANLLPGRVVNFNLGPLVSAELDYKMDTQKALELGGLPEIYLMKNLSSDDLTGLDFFSKEFSSSASLYIFHNGTKEKKIGKIWSLPWQLGLKKLGL